MINNWALIFYVVSSVALGYADLVHSPLNFDSQTWEKTSTPALFFPISILFIIHVVFTGKKFKDEKFPQVIRNSSIILLFSVILLFNDIIMAYVSYWLSLVG